MATATVKVTVKVTVMVTVTVTVRATQEPQSLGFRLQASGFSFKA